jgi:hypothetical protein
VTTREVFFWQNEMKWRAAALVAVLCVGLFGCKSKSAAETKIPQEEIDRKNPIESNPTANFPTWS